LSLHASETLDWGDDRSVRCRYGLHVLFSGKLPGKFREKVKISKMATELAFKLADDQRPD
jgi:hypothetical protein